MSPFFETGNDEEILLMSKIRNLSAHLVENLLLFIWLRIRVSRDDVSHWNVMPRSDYKSVSQWVRRIHIHKNLDFDIILVHFYTVMRIKILSGRTFYNANVTG